VKNDYKLASRDFSKVLEIDSLNFDALLNSGSVATHSRDKDKTFEFYGKAEAIDSLNSNLFVQKGFAYYIFGNTELACFEWNKALDLGDGNVKINYIDKYCSKQE